VDAPTTARSPATSAPPHPFEPRALLAHLSSPICALCPTLSPSLSLCPRVQGALPPPTVDRCLVCGRRRALLSSATVRSALLSAARDTLRCAPSLSAASGPHSPEQSLQPEPRHRHPVESPCLRRCFTMPALPLKVSNLLVPLIWSFQLCCSRDCSPEQPRTAVSPPRRGPRSLVPLRQREGHGRTHQIALNAPELAPEPLEPCRGQPPRLR
jgi:hypothetical protein